MGSEFVAVETNSNRTDHGYYAVLELSRGTHFLKVLLLGDNKSVVKSATLPHSTLIKDHNILAFHRVRDAIAAKLMALYWIQSAYNLNYMLCKHWDHPSVYPMILKLLIYKGNISSIPREATQEKEKGNYKIQPEKVKMKEKEE